jgi:hypothetical protein
MQGFSGVPRVMGKGENVIKLNVGGRLFVTTRATLDAVPDTYLSILASGRWGGEALPQDAEGNVFLDWTPEVFETLLSFLRARAAGEKVR